MGDFHRKVLRFAVNRKGICTWLLQSFRHTVNIEITAEGWSLFCCSSVVLVTELLSCYLGESDDQKGRQRPWKHPARI